MLVTGTARTPVQYWEEAKLAPRLRTTPATAGTAWQLSTRELAWHPGLPPPVTPGDSMRQTFTDAGDQLTSETALGCTLLPWRSTPQWQPELKHGDRWDKIRHTYNLMPKCE